MAKLFQDHDNYYRVCVGMTNYLGGTSRCVFLDYDESTLAEVKKDARALASKYLLHSYAIIQSQAVGHYWVISPQVVREGECLGILYDANCDDLYISAFKHFKRSVIRLTPKSDEPKEFVPKCVYSWVEPWSKYSKLYRNGKEIPAHSAGHADLMRLAFGCKLTPPTRAVEFGMEFCDYALAEPKGLFTGARHYFKLGDIAKRMVELREGSRASK